MFVEEWSIWHTICQIQAMSMLYSDGLQPILWKTFGKLRQESGGTYFITAQSVIGKTRLHRAKLCLELGVDIGGFASHECVNSKRKLTEMETECFDVLPELYDKLKEDTMLSIIHIAGCVEKKQKQKLSDTKEYQRTRRQHGAVDDLLLHFIHPIFGRPVSHVCR